MISAIQRVASIHTAAIGDAKELFREYEAIVEKHIRKPEAQVKRARELITESAEMVAKSTREEYRAWRETITSQQKHEEDEIKRFAFECYLVVTTRSSVWLSDAGHKLFLSLLQTYTLPPALRKKVEIASRVYLKTVKPRKPKGNTYIVYLDLYEKYMSMVEDHLAIAKLAIAKGVEHSEGSPTDAQATKIKVGPWTLINTGGFTPKVMDGVIDVVQKATSLLQSSGFGSICYGDIQVTNTIHKSNVLAFYLIAQDDLFIRANVKPDVDTVRTVLHELGHRHEKMVLKDQRGVEQLYYLLSGQERTRSTNYKSMPKPAKGDTLVHKGTTFYVETVLPSLKGMTVVMSTPGKSGTASVPLDSFWELKGVKARDIDNTPDFIGFVTEYAKKSPSENYAEMFSFYCMGRLPTLQSAPFEALAFK